MDLYIEKEINTKDILGIYEVKKINEYYYITNFIKNENFKDEWYSSFIIILIFKVCSNYIIKVIMIYIYLNKLIVIIIFEL